MPHIFGLPYVMPASPWFYTNLLGYKKNWLWRGDDLCYDRWQEIWYLKPPFVEIISWNDYGESHYIRPPRDHAMEAFDVGRAPYNYVTDMPHDSWRLFLPFLIDTYKYGTATIDKEGLTVWHRPQPAAASGSQTEALVSTTAAFRLDPARGCGCYVRTRRRTDRAGPRKHHFNCVGGLPPRRMLLPRARRCYHGTQCYRPLGIPA
ncbi:glycosyl hydrolase family 71-domain-containing protein [Aspergillus navahoensis]